MNKLFQVSLFLMLLLISPTLANSQECYKLQKCSDCLACGTRPAPTEIRLTISGLQLCDRPLWNRDCRGLEEYINGVHILEKSRESSADACIWGKTHLYQCNGAEPVLLRFGVSWNKETGKWNIGVHWAGYMTNFFSSTPENIDCENGVSNVPNDYKAGESCKEITDESGTPIYIEGYGGTATLSDFVIPQPETIITSTDLSGYAAGDVLDVTSPWEKSGCYGLEGPAGCTEAVEINFFVCENCSECREGNCKKVQKSYFFAERREKRKKTIYLPENPIEINNKQYLYLNDNGISSNEENPDDYDRLGCYFETEENVKEKQAKEIWIEKLENGRFVEIPLTRKSNPVFDCSQVVLNTRCKYVFKDERLYKYGDKSLPRKTELRCNIRLKDDEPAMKSDNLILIERNMKDEKRYKVFEGHKLGERPVFLVSDEEWHGVLQAVPVAIDKNKNIKYPLLIYHKEENKYDMDSINHFINQYKASSIISIKNYWDRTNALKQSNANLPKIWIEPGDLHSFWKEKGIVIVADYTINNYEDSLYAAQLAAYLGVPLIFAGSDNADEMEGFLYPRDEKQKYIPKLIVAVGAMSPYIGQKILKNNIVLMYRTINVNGENRKGLSYLHLPSTTTFAIPTEMQEFITYLARSKKMIFINPDDIKEEYSEKQRRLHWYYKISLAAPYYAAVTDAAIATIKLDSPAQHMVGVIDKIDNDKIISAANKIYQQIGNTFSRLFTPQYAIFLAAPTAIPLSKKNSEYNDSDKFLLSLDRIFLDRNNDNKEDMPFGRIYTKTISGTSSYINRILFGIRNSRNLFLSLAPNLMIYDAPNTYMTSLNIQLNKAGYTAKCYSVFNPLGICSNKFPQRPYNEFKNQKIILYSGHGCSNEIQYSNKKGHIYAEELPEMDSSIIIADSCSTNDYYHSYDYYYVFGPEAIEKGALAYIGLVGIGMGVGGFIDTSGLGEEISRFLLHEDGLDTGTVLKKIYTRVSPTLLGSDYILMGDPTYKPNIIRLSYPYISSTNIIKTKDRLFKNKEIEFSVSDLNGLDNVGKIETIAINKNTGEKEFINTECEEVGDEKKCSSDFRSKKSGKYIIEMRANDKENKYYGSIYREFETIPLFIFHDCYPEGSIRNRKIKCKASISSINDDFDEVILKKTEGGNIEGVPASLSSSQCTRKSAGKYKCEFPLLIPKEKCSYYVFKAVGFTKSKDNNGHRFSYSIVNPRKIEIKDISTRIICRPLFVEVGKEVTCKVYIDVTEKDNFHELDITASPLGNPDIIKDIDGLPKKISPSECKYDSNKIRYTCEFKITPKKVGEFKIIAVATSKTMDNNNRRCSYSDVDYITTTESP